MTTRIRVAHVPARTPYARKLSSERVEIVNETRPHGQDLVPRDLTLAWLLTRRPFDWFDVLHLHHVEFDTQAQLEEVLDECDRSRRRVVFTAHDVDPIFNDASTYRAKLRTLVDHRVPFVCLTKGSEAMVDQILGPGVDTYVVPHGYVVSPSLSTDLRNRYKQRPLTHLLFGSLRANRELGTVLYNWRFSERQRKTRLKLLLRAPGPVHLSQEQDRWELIAAMSANEPRLHVNVAPYPTDAEVASVAAECDSLILPYLWASHSGQLELAFDVGLLAISSSVGHLRDQYEQHDGLVLEPVWFDWSDGAEYTYGERFLAALDRAVELSGERSTSPTKDFLEHRRLEHDHVLGAYHDVYERRWP